MNSEQFVLCDIHEILLIQKISRSDVYNLGENDVKTE
jgi:hypothetical protein